MHTNFVPGNDKKKKRGLTLFSIFIEESWRTLNRDCNENLREDEI